MSLPLSKLRLLAIALTACVPFTFCYSSWAVDVPFLEDFSNNSAGWANFNSTALLTHHAAGGPDGGAYASGPRVLNGLTPGNTTIVLRARHDSPWNSSNDAFVGDWIAAGARNITAWFKHDIPTPVTIFARAATTANFPGHVYVDGIGSDPNTWKQVQPNTWTQLYFDMSQASLQLVSPEGGTWDGVFSGVGHVQFGLFVPAGFETNTTPYNIGVDKVFLNTPEPTSTLLALLGIAGGCLIRHRRHGCRPILEMQ